MELTIEGPVCKGEKRGSQLERPAGDQRDLHPSAVRGATVVTHGGDRGWNALQCRGKQGRHRRGGRLSTALGRRGEGTNSVNRRQGTMSAARLDRLPPEC